MSSLGSGTLPRKPPVSPDYRRYVCPECGEPYHSPSGIEPFACPPCKLKPDVKAKIKARTRERRLVREAQRKAGR